MSDDLKRTQTNHASDCGCGSNDSGENKVVDTSRRRFTSATLAAPIAASLIARPVSASLCSPSGFSSLNLSDNRDDECRGNGCTPGYWKGAVLVWQNDAGFVGRNGMSLESGSCAVINGGGNNCHTWTDNGTAFVDSFPNVPLIGDFPPLEGSNVVTVYAVIKNHQGGNGQKEGSFAEYSGPYGTFLFHMIAAYLNANIAPDYYGATVAELDTVLDMVFGDEATKTWQEAKDLFVGMNEAGSCFMNRHGDCKTGLKDANGNTIPFVSNEGGQCIPVCAEGYEWDSTALACVPIEQQN